jgi:hypothetical protein
LACDIFNYILKYDSNNGNAYLRIAEIYLNNLNKKKEAAEILSNASRVVDFGIISKRVEELMEIINNQLGISSPENVFVGNFGNISGQIEDKINMQTDQSDIFADFNKSNRNDI